MEDLPKVQLRQAISTEPTKTIKKENTVKKSDKKAAKAAKEDKKAAKVVKEDKKVTKAVKSDKKVKAAKVVKEDKSAKVTKEDKKAAKAVKSDKNTKTGKSAATLSAAVVSPVASVKLDLAVPSTVHDNLMIFAVRAFNSAHSVKTIKESINVGAAYARQVSKTITPDALAAIRNDVAATFDKKVSSVINKAVASSSKGKLDKDGYTAAQNALADLFPVKKVKGKK